MMLKKILCGATLLCAASFSNAATITLEQEVDVATTNFTTTLDFARFDTMGGTRTLNSVTFSIDGSIFGTARVESGDAQAATIVTTLAAELQLIDAMMNTLVVTIPSITRTFDAAAFDGDLDFMGVSGETFDNLSATRFEQESYTDAATLAFFTGAGDSTLVFDAQATSSSSGAGNLTSQFTSTAGGIVQVIYDFDEITVSVSAPAHLALLGLSLVGFAGVRRLRK